MVATALLISLIGSVSQLQAGECWDTRENAEIKGYSELDDIVLLSFKDAVECTPISGATVTVNGESIPTNSKGYAELSLDQFMELDDAKIAIVVKKRGYATLKTYLDVQAGTVWNHRFSMTKALGADQVRFVLQWQDKPKDMDLHLIADDFHISYQNMRSYRNRAKLDRDDMNGYGPETITLNRVDPNKKYQLYVYNYSNRKPIKNVSVFVYAGDVLVEEISLPTTSNRIVDVLEIDQASISVINRVR